MLTDSLEAVLRQAADLAAFPLWTATDRTPPSPVPRAIPFVWPYAPLRNLLLQARQYQPQRLTRHFNLQPSVDQH